MLFFGRQLETIFKPPPPFVRLYMYCSPLSQAQEKEAERITKNKRKVDVNEEDDDVTDDSDDD